MNLTNVFESTYRLCLLKVVQWEWLPLCNGLKAVLFSFPLPTWRRRRTLQDDVLLINTDDEQWLNVTKLRCSETQSNPQSTGVSLFRILPQQFPWELKFMFSFRVEVQVYEYDTRSKMLFYRWRSVIYFGADYTVTVFKVKRHEIIVSDISTEEQTRIAVGLLWVMTRMWTSRHSVMPQSNPIWNFLGSLLSY